MKTFQQSSLTLKAVILTVLCISLFSFMPGGDSFSILLNKKQVAKEFISRQFTPPVILLDQPSESDVFEVYFSECGQIGKSRALTIRDDQKTLAAWKYANVTGEHSPMTFTGKDLMAFRKAGKQLKLYYTSETLTDGRQIASLAWGNNVVVKK